MIPKEPLARELARIIRERELSQTSAAMIIGEAPSQLSLIMTGKLQGFSPDRLMRSLIRFGRDVEIRLGRRRSGGRAGRVTVKVE